jgi:glycosyltransferase involved in cell wall biosynthesis
MLRQPFVLTIHDTEVHPGDLPSQKTPQWAIEIAYRRADQIIAHAEYVKASFLAKYPIGPERLHVIPHIKLGEETVQTAVLEENNTVLFFGRIWEYKGLEYLIRAEPLITAEVPGAKIVIAGQGEDFSRYRQMMVHPENFVVLNQYVSDAERDELFQRASVVALPYIEASQSGVVPVACTFSKPVVATTVGGLPEAVDDGHTGFCVPPRDEKALAQAIVRLLKDPALRKCFGANANRKINAEGLPAIVAKSTLEVYRRAMARSAPKTLAL